MYRQKYVQWPLYFRPALKLEFTNSLITSFCLNQRSSYFINAHGVFCKSCEAEDKCAQTPPSSFSVPVPRPFPQNPWTMAAASAIVSRLCFCLRVPEAPLRLPEARQECGRRGVGGGMSRKESERKGQGRQYLSAQGPHGSCVSVFIT